MTPKLVINTKAPTVPTLKLDPSYATPGLTNTTSAVPSLYDGTTDPGTVVNIFDNGQLVSNFTEGGSRNFTSLLNLTDGQHLLTVKATDLAGNVSTFAPANPDGKLGLEITVNQDALDPSRKFIRQIYFDALGRPGSLSEWNNWLGLLQQPNGRFLVANAINRAYEARDFTVKGWYSTFLGRQANGQEELGWVNLMYFNGFTEEQTLSLILGSPEYYNHAAAIQGNPTPTDTTFVTALYEQLLNRVPSQGEVNVWLPNIPKIGRTGVAFAFLTGTEYREDVVRGYYLTLLRR